jgi:hypothetical protein
MWRVDSDRIVPAGLEADESAGLGAVAMQDVGLQLPDQALEARPYQEVGRQRVAANRQAVNTQLEARGDFRKRLLGAFAAGEAVGDDADVMTAVGLAIGQIQNMTKNPTHRGTRRVQDTKRLAFDDSHDQRQRPVRAGAATGQWLGASAPRITRILKNDLPD